MRISKEVILNKCGFVLMAIIFSFLSADKNMYTYSAQDIYSLHNVNKCEVKGYLDRFVDNQMAVILLEDRGKELLYHKEELPNGSKERIWFTMKRIEENYSICSIDSKKTDKEFERANKLLNKLR